jgi:hypothetical protein
MPAVRYLLGASSMLLTQFIFNIVHFSRMVLIAGGAGGSIGVIGESRDLRCAG